MIAYTISCTVYSKINPPTPMMVFWIYRPYMKCADVWIRRVTSISCYYQVPHHHPSNHSASYKCPQFLLHVHNTFSIVHMGTYQIVVYKVLAWFLVQSLKHSSIFPLIWAQTRSMALGSYPASHIIWSILYISWISALLTSN